MFISVALKYLFPHPLPLWLAAAAILVGHAPLLVLPGLLSRIELLYLSVVLCFLFFIRNRGSIFIRIIISVFLIANIQLNNTLSLFSSDNKSMRNIDIIVHDVIIKTTDFYTIKGKVININDEKINDDIYINIKIKGAFVPECAGEVWRIFRPVLRPVHKQLNEGQPDRQQYALSQRVLFSLTPGRSKKISSVCNTRQRVITENFPQTDNFAQGGLMLALLFGERRGITPQQRVLVQETGVAHVVAISGLHIGLAALWGWWAGRIVLLILPQRLMSHLIPVLFSVCAAVMYVWLAGFAVPACRALTVLLLWHLMRWKHYVLPAYQFVFISAALLLLIDPLTILSASFWLSFIAVTALLLWHYTGAQQATTGIMTRHERFWRNIRGFLSYQWGLFLLLLPVQAFFFGGINLLSLLSNLWVIPVISFLSVPLLFSAITAGLFLPVTVTGFIWQAADFSLGLALWPLPFLSSFWLITGHVSLLWTAVVWGSVCFIRLDLRRQHPVLLPGMIICCCLYLRKTPVPDWSVTLLDIGHGLAVVVEKEGRAVVYDTGNRMGHSDDAQRVILPYLRHHRLIPDWIIISHDHQDHTGGLATLRRHYPAAGVKGNIPRADTSCERGERWVWQSLYFEVLWPDGRYQKSKNDGSCVIRISDGKHQVLLTGDIEKQAEMQLVKSENRLSATVLQVPHHGSNTSSTESFIRAVNPSFALVSVARYSPWRLPSDKVQHRYRHHGTDWHDTAHSGQISVHFLNDDITLVTYRHHLSARWFSAWFGDQPING